MTDVREELIRSIELKLFTTLTDDELYRRVVQDVIQCVDEYEITQRTTEVGFYNDSNADLMQQFVASRMVEGIKKSSLKAYLYELKRFDEFLQTPFNEVTVGQVRKYLATCKTRGCSNRTLENIRSYLATFFSWCVANEFISKSPLATIPPIRFQHDIKPAFTEVDMLKIRENCKNTRDRCMVEFLAATACRISEAVNVQMSDINLYEKSVRIIGKGGKVRIAYFNDTARLRIEEYLASKKEPTQYLFTSLRAPYDKVSAAAIRKSLHGISEISGVNKIHPHRFRRTSATFLIDSGMPIQEVSLFLGHTSIATTQTYYDNRLSNIHASYDKCHRL